MKVSKDGSGYPVFVGAFVGFLVKGLPLGGEAVFGPDLFVVDESTLARAVEPVLEGGEGDHHGVGESETQIDEWQLFPGRLELRVCKAPRIGPPGSS